MILASHGLIASQIASFDADAAAFFDRVTTAGGTLTTTEKTAVNQLVLDLKANSLWAPMKAIYPWVGASAAACAQNLKSSSFTGTFSSGWTFASTGVTPNGTSAYMDTNIRPSTDLQLNNVHLTSYLATTVNELGCQIGVIDSVNGLFAFWYYTPLEGLFARTNSATNTFIFVDATRKAGFRLLSRTSSNLSKHFLNNTNSYTSTGLSNALPIYKIFIGARATGNSTATDFSAIKQNFASIGDGLTDTQASNFYTAVQAFQTTLSRQV
jgi:hypothetical protein